MSLPIFFILTGLVSTAAQVIIIREVIQLLSGNELSIGFALGSWLFWTGIGALCFDKFLPETTAINDRGTPETELTSGIRHINERKVPFGKYLFFLAILGVLTLVTIFLIRLSRLYLNIPFGEITGPGLMLLVPFVSFAPISFVGGGLFSLGNRIWIMWSSEVRAGLIYSYEALGAGLAGIIITILFHCGVSNIEAGLACAVIAAVIPSLFSGKRLHAAFWTLLLIFFIIMFPYFKQTFYPLIYGQQNLEESRDTPYGNLTVLSLEEMVNVYENSVLLYSSPDPQTVEENVHFGMLQHPRPEIVLLLGGSTSGLIPEVLKYKTVTRIIGIELDGVLTTLAGRYLPENIPVDPRVHLITGDGRQYLSGSHETFDVILLNMPAPLSAQINRFFTKEFFMMVKEKLSPDGVIAFSQPSSENYLSEAHIEFLTGIRETLNIFKKVIIIPGNTAVFIASRSDKYLTDDAEKLLLRLKERGIKNDYFRDYYLRDRLSPYRREFFEKSLAEAPPPKPNHDLIPTGYFYAFILWSTQFTNVTRRILLFFAPLWRLVTFLVIISVIPIIWGLFGLKRGRIYGFEVSAATVGFTEISLEFLLIIGYQTFFGVLYGNIALLIASYMVGLTIGSWISSKRIRVRGGIYWSLIWIQGFIGVLALITAGVFMWLSSTKTGWIAQGIIFGLVFLAGLAGGLQFPVLNSLSLSWKRLHKKRPQEKEKRGYIYGVDLIGSSIGAVLSASLLLPLLGIKLSLLYLFWINLISILLLAFSYRRYS